MGAKSTDEPAEQPKEVWRLLGKLCPHYQPYKGNAYVLLAPPTGPEGGFSFDDPFDAVVHLPYQQSELECMGQYRCYAKASAGSEEKEFKSSSQFHVDSGWYFLFRDVPPISGNSRRQMAFYLDYEAKGDQTCRLVWSSKTFSGPANDWTGDEYLKKDYNAARAVLSRDRLRELFPTVWV